MNKRVEFSFKIENVFQQFGGRIIILLLCRNIISKIVSSFAALNKDDIHLKSLH